MQENKPEGAQQKDNSEKPAGEVRSKKERRNSLMNVSVKK